MLYLVAVILLSSALSFVHAQTNLKQFEQKFCDSLITTKITAKYTKDRDLNPLKISVSTKKGMVTLKGFVKDKQAFINALKLAKATNGVKIVNADDLLIRKVNTALTDAYITAKVEAAILKAKVFDDDSIPIVGVNASTCNGTVTLSGKMKHKRSVAFVLKRVNKVRGVKKVISKLEV